MRLGRRPGVTAATELLLPFARGGDILQDLSPDERTVSYAGSGRRPRWAPGYFGNALEFGSGIQRLSVTGFSLAAGFSVEAWVRTDDGASERTVIAATAEAGGQNSVFRLGVSATGATLTVWNNGSLASDSVSTSPARARPTASAVWQHVRGWWDGTSMGIDLDGQRWAFKPTSISATSALNLPALVIGGEESLSLSSTFTGRLECVRICSPGETGTAGLSPLARPDRVTRRTFDLRHIELREHAQADTWTNDAAGGFHMPLSDLTVGGFVVAPEDVVSVRARTLVVTTEFTAVGNVTDLDAGTNNYFVDPVTQRLYSSEDPTGYSVFEVGVLIPLADRPLVRGTRFYRGVVLPSPAGERRAGFYGEPPPTGGGGALALAAAYTDVDGTFVREEASKLAWRGAPVTTYEVHDGAPYSEATRSFIGFVEEPPDDSKDLLSVQTKNEIARLYKVPLQGQIATRGDWTYLDESAEGHVFPVITGLGHRKIKCIRVDTRWTDLGSSAFGYRYKFCAHGVARIAGLWVGGAFLLGVKIHNIDLSVGEFWYGVTPGETEIMVDVDGYGTAGTPTSSVNQVLPFGNSSDCLSSPEDIIDDAYLRGLLGVAADEIGASFAVTGTRVKRGIRRADPVGDAGAAVATVGKHLDETLTTLYHSATSGDYEWEDVVKADAIQHTLYDIDVIAEVWRFDRSRLAKKINALATAYIQDLQGRVTVQEATDLDLLSDLRYDVKDIADLGLTGIYNAATVDVHLAVVRALMESSLAFYGTTVSPRFSRAEIFDVFDLQVASRPSGMGTRFRVLSVNVRADRNVDLVLFSETPFPATGTSTFGSRIRFSPSRRLTYSAGGVQALADTAGAWAVVGTHREPFQGPLLIPAGASHRFQVRARRIGGAADADLDFRVEKVGGGTIFALGGCSTTLGFQTADTTPGTIPITDEQIRLEYKTAVGVTGEISSGGWEHEEASPLLSDPLAPTTLWSWGNNSGASVASPGDSTTGRGGLIGSLGLFSGARLRFAVHFDPGTATGIRFYIYTNAQQWNGPLRTIFDTGVVTTSPATTEVLQNPIGALAPLYFSALCSTGTMTVYGASIDLVNPDPRRYCAWLANWGPSDAAYTTLADTGGAWASLDGHEQVRQHLIDLDNTTAVRWLLGCAFQPFPGVSVGIRLRDETAGITILGGDTAMTFGTGPYYPAAATPPISGLSAADWRMRLEYKTTGGTVPWYGTCVQVMTV